MTTLGFNKKVWQALKRIPKGKVTTYGELARYLGKPKAGRAVGNACGKNPNAPAVPCHRVVKSDGGLGGYAGGTNKKIKLLKKEGVAVKKLKIEEFKKILFKFK